MADHLDDLIREGSNGMKNRIKSFSVAALAGALLLASGVANAKGAYDGKSDLICASFNVMACVDGMNCVKGEARDFEMPEFMRVDVKKKVVFATYESESKRADSPIKNMEVNGSQLILQGVENAHGWSMAIHRDTGRMSLAVVGEQLSFSIFGACKAL
jgi:uncharacterized Fe-S cluster protein YjdI